ncbi:defensin-like protein 19 [Juglans microcarpa x Juglans regia]|uniref:defensin-like protein 19 n=1 Tax=Juglans microcarpa x Juglans regia TaxID=2249226 RepID=UPI001B7F71A5|nr:defensin-like protein 19 [Juglans microcarpa x Juglans regia]
MAKQLGRQLLSYVLIFLLLLLLLSSGKIAMVEAKLCEKRSKTWSGFCAPTPETAGVNSERAQHGACHAQFPGFACFCYFKC